MEKLKWWVKRIGLLILCLAMTATVTAYADVSSEQEYYNAVYEMAEEIVETLELDGKSTYEKTLLVYQYVCDNITYDDTLHFDVSYEAAYHAFTEGTTDNYGFADVFAALCNHAGVSNFYVNGFQEKQLWTWNIVKIGRHFYNVDCTLDAGNSPENYQYFLKSDADFTEHINSDSTWKNLWYVTQYPMAKYSYDPENPPAAEELPKDDEVIVWHNNEIAAAIRRCFYAGTEITVEKVKDFSTLGKEIVLTVDETTDLQDLQYLPGLSVLALRISGTPQNAEALAELKNLECLYLYADDASMDSLAAVLEALPYVGKIIWKGNYTNVDALAALQGTSLHTLELFDNRHLEDLTGVSSMEKLRYLNVNQAGVSDLTPLGSLTELQYLNMGATNVSDLTPLSALKKLQYLNANSTAVADIAPLGSLTELRYLELGYTLVTDIEKLGGLTKLSYLNLNNCAVSDITVLRNMTELKELCMGNADIPDISSLSGLTKLQNLVLDHCNISDITPLQNLTNLIFLNLNHNTISDMTALSGLTRLRELQLWSNPVSDITAAGNMTKLNYLLLHNCPVSDITVLKNLTRLEHLHLSGCEVSDAAPLNGLTNLKRLDLSQCPVSDITALGTLTKLEELVLMECNISNLTALSNLINLKLLDLRGNPITALAGLESLTGLDTLYLYDCMITDVTPLSTLTGLTQLRLDGNEISDLTPLSRLTGLQLLSVNRCQVTDVTPLSVLTNLYFLELSGNRISDITPLGSLYGMGSLDISENEITDITALGHMPRLYCADLRGANNKITDYSPVTHVATVWKSDWDTTDDEVLVWHNKEIEQLVRKILEKPEGDIYSREVKQLHSADVGVVVLHVDQDTDLQDLTYLPETAFYQFELYIAGVPDSMSILGQLPYVTGMWLYGLTEDTLNELLPFLAAMPSLRSLGCRGTLETLGAGMGELTGLEELSLMYCGVKDITVLKEMVTLKMLYLADCAVTDLTALSNLTDLEFLDVSGCVVSDITALAGLTKLTYVSFGGTTNKITDYSPVDHVLANGGTVIKSDWVSSGQEPTPTPEPTAVPTETPDATPAPTLTPEEQKEQVNNFVERLYTTLLGRDAEAEGLKYWSDILNSKLDTGANVAANMVFSEEIQNSSLSNEEYITRLYLTVFDRVPDEGGMKYWVGALEQGGQRTHVGRDILNSAEFEDVCARYGIVAGKVNAPSEDSGNDGNGGSTGGTTQEEQVQSFVKRLYSILLGREVDTDGLEYWSDLLIEKESTGAGVAAEIVFSKELEDRGLSDKQYISSLYKTVFNREADEGGLEYWMSVLASGVSRRTVGAELLNSPEFGGICAEYGIEQGQAEVPASTPKPIETPAPTAVPMVTPEPTKAPTPIPEVSIGSFGREHLLFVLL